MEDRQRSRLRSRGLEEGAAAQVLCESIAGLIAPQHTHTHAERDPAVRTVDSAILKTKVLRDPVLKEELRITLAEKLPDQSQRGSGLINPKATKVREPFTLWIQGARCRSLLRNPRHSPPSATSIGLTGRAGLDHATLFYLGRGLITSRSLPVD